MARLRGTVSWKAISAGSGGTAKTVGALLAAANQRVAWKELSINFHGVSNTAEPITVEIVKMTTAGTMSSATPTTDDQDAAETFQTSGFTNATVEPTITDILRTFAVHPQTGLVYQFTREDEIIIKGGGRIGVRCTNNGSAVNTDGHIHFEE